MTRTTHPPEPAFYVCRHCRSVMLDPQPAPFCDALCAAMWAFWQTSSEPRLLEAFTCEAPPDSDVVLAWRDRELIALRSEVR